MQAIGLLSRREHSRRELRAKLLEALRKRAREDAALAAAAETAADELAQALAAQPANGIDDAFAPRVPPHPVAGAPAAAGGRARLYPHASRGGTDAAADVEMRAPAYDGLVDDVRDAPNLDPASSDSGLARSGTSALAALDTLTMASGAAMPSRLRASLVATIATAPSARHASTSIGAGTGTGTGTGTEPVPPEPAAGEPDADDDLERSDPEAAVDRLLDWLAANKYLSDVRFVESRVSARSRKQGTLRIKLELSRHGLALEPEQATALRETEFARAQALWQRKFGTVAVEARERAKQARFLASRGFAADVVRRIVGGEEEF